MSTRSAPASLRPDPPPARATAAPRPPDPLWARLLVVLGSLLLLVSGTALIGGQLVVARYTGAVDEQEFLPPDEGEEKRTEIDRDKPLNVLLVGIDERPNNNEPVRGDTVIMVHVPKGHDRAYLLSLPRDLRVEIPASPPHRKRAGRDRLNAALPLGAEHNGGLAGGMQLLTRTITTLTGVTPDAAAVINFDGFKAVVRELGGVTMCLDHEIKSEHMGTRDGKYRHPAQGGKPWVYPVGCHHLTDEQALDVVRQRKTVPGGDYGRQRNQQRFLKAMVQQAKTKGVVTDPRKLDGVLRAVGGAVSFDGGGVSPAEWAWSLRDISESSIVMIRTPAVPIGEGEGYQGEELQPVGLELFAALRDNRIEEFILSHQDLINQP